MRASSSSRPTKPGASTSSPPSSGRRTTRDAACGAPVIRRRARAGHIAHASRSSPRITLRGATSLHRVALPFEAGAEGLVEFRLGVRRRLLLVCRGLLFGRSIFLLLLGPAAHATRGGADGRALSGIARDRSNGGPHGCALCGSLDRAA